MAEHDDDLLADLGVDASYLARLKSAAAVAAPRCGLTASGVEAKPLSLGVAMSHGSSAAGVAGSAIAGVGSKRRRPDECAADSDETKSEIPIPALARPALAKASVIGSGADEELFLDYGDDSDDGSGSDNMAALSAARSRGSGVALDRPADSRASPSLDSAAGLEPCEPVCQGCGVTGAGCVCDVAGEVRAGSRDPVAVSLGHGGDAAVAAPNGRDSVPPSRGARASRLHLASRSAVDADARKASKGGVSSRAFRNALQRAAGGSSAAAAAAASASAAVAVLDDDLAGGMSSSSSSSSAAAGAGVAGVSVAIAGGSSSGGTGAPHTERTIKRGRWAEAFGVASRRPDVADAAASGAPTSAVFAPGSLASAPASASGRGMAEDGDDDDDENGHDAAHRAAAAVGAAGAAGALGSASAAQCTSAVAGTAAGPASAAIVRPKAVGTFAAAFAGSDDCGFAFDAMDDSPSVLPPQAPAVAADGSFGCLGARASAASRPVLTSPVAAAGAAPSSSSVASKLALDDSPPAPAADDFSTPAAPAGPRVRFGAICASSARGDGAACGGAGAGADADAGPSSSRLAGAGSSDASAGGAAAAPSPSSSSTAAAAVVEQLSAALGERNLAALGLAVAELPGGAAQALSLVEDVMAVETAGGMTTADGSRRRTPGGVFFALLRDLISREAYKRVLAPQTAAHNAARNARKRATF